jgi:cation:H+ antiporter
VGNALGSCVVNLLFLVVVDALQRKQSLYRRGQRDTSAVGGFRGRDARASSP